MKNILSLGDQMPVIWILDWDRELLHISSKNPFSPLFFLNIIYVQKYLIFTSSTTQFIQNFTSSSYFKDANINIQKIGGFKPK